jgi:hypothetical protein
MDQDRVDCKHFMNSLACRKVSFVFIFPCFRADPEHIIPDPIPSVRNVLLTKHLYRSTVPVFRIRIGFNADADPYPDPDPGF